MTPENNDISEDWATEVINILWEESENKEQFIDMFLELLKMIRQGEII